MIELVVVIVEPSKSIYYLDPNGLKLEVKDKVVINTEYGKFIGTVLKSNYLEEKDNLLLPLNIVDRIATDSDLEIFSELKSASEEVLSYSKSVSKFLDLDMSFIDAEFNLDKSVLIITYVSDSRVDFRELAKKIAQKYKARIELRQIGVRDKSKRIGGIGPCGLFLCCNSFLTDFNSVSINMAKNQSLALSPTKINGVCGRLLCCLGYENDVYTELKENLPKVGSIISNGEIEGKVISVDVLKGTYKVEIKDKEIIELSKDTKNESFK